MDITKLLLSQLGDNGLNEISKTVGTDSNKTKSALEGIIPSLLGAMSNNAKSNDGANGLLGALDRDHDGSILDDITGFLGNTEKQAEGDGIIKHVLGDKRNTVEESLAAKTGLSSMNIDQIMKIAAPLLMGFLGKQKRESASSGFDTGNIASILSNFAGSSDKGTGLDLSDIMNVVGSLTGGNGGSSSKSGGIGGLLRGLFSR